jgi:hypothetical protein
MRLQLRAMIIFLGSAVYVVLAIFYLRHTESVTNGQWWSASRESAGIAPDPRTTPEAVVQVYAARTVGWRGYVGVHTWIAVKRAEASRFTVYEVIGYRISSGNVVVASNRSPDGYWFGARPELLSDVRGEGVNRIIDDIEAAVRSYPYANRYRVWPGPNSNTFIAWVLRHAPKLHADLPATAIGKDYLGWLPIAKAPSNTGVQINVFGILGVIVAWREGIELNILGLTFGVDPRRLSIKLPLIGRVGLIGNHFPSRLQAEASAPRKTL